MSTTAGLKFKKFDLQVHTPGSSDFRDRSATPEDIVKAAIDKGLSGIAITDHQSGSWVDKVKIAAKKSGLVVFPGVELRVHGGQDGIHLLAIFDVDKSSEHVQAFLNTLKVYTHLGDPVDITDKTSVEVAASLQEFDKSAILVLAHCLSGQGALGELRGSQRSNLFRPEYTCLLGAEASEKNFTDEKKTKDHDRVVDLFDGGFSDFHYKKLGVYQASDAHSIDEIGSRYTYFKVDDEITIEDLRQSLIDRDMRIRQSFEFTATSNPRIQRLRITSGFLDGLDVEFHEGLNSFLGAKGSGKSLVIEFLRFALNQQPAEAALLADHELKLEKCLKLYGSVEVTIVDESGKSYLVKRTYNPAEGNPIQIIDPIDGTAKDFHIEEVFPLLFLSQNEIIKIAEDRTGGSQREFIDRFFDFRRYQQEIERLTKQLIEIDEKFAASLGAHLNVNSLTRNIATTDEEIKKLDRQITNAAFERFSRLERVGQAIGSQHEFIGSLLLNIKTLQDEVSLLAPPSSGNNDIDDDPAVKRSIGKSQEALDKVISDLAALSKLLTTKQANIAAETSGWRPGYDEAKAEHDRIVKEAGGTQIALNQRRTKLVQDLAKLQTDLSSLQAKALQLKIIGPMRAAIIERLEAAYRAYFDERKNRCNYFTASSGGTLEVSIRERQDSTAFRQNLLKFKRGSWLKDEDVEAVANQISPKDFIDALLRYEYSGRAKKSVLQEIVDKTGIKLENVEKLAHHLLDEHHTKKSLLSFTRLFPRTCRLLDIRWTRLLER